jgi:hypothetical protein
LKKTSPGIGVDDRYRTVSEQQIVDILLVAAFVFELDAGQRESAMARIYSALDAWVELGLGYRISGDGNRLFDPVEVINHMKWAGYQGHDDFWINHFVGTSRAFFSESSLVLPNSGFPSFNRRDPARFSVSLRRTFDLSGIEVGQKLRLRLPLPLSQSSEDIEIEPFASADLSARIIRSEGRLDFQFAASSRPVVEIAAKISFTTDGRSKDDLPERPISNEANVYLRGSEGLIRVTPRVQALSQKLAGTGGDQHAVAIQFFRYIVDELMCGMVHYDQVHPDAPGDWVLESGWYDCQLGSALFVSMCRASGIPARILSGHMLYRLAPGFHYWAEIWTGGQGWIPFDFLNWDLSQGGRDAAWRNCFIGTIDYRMVTQCFPLIFTGPMSVRFPSAWHLINAPLSSGMEINFTELNGRLIYRDRVTLQKQAD